MNHNRQHKRKKSDEPYIQWGRFSDLEMMVRMIFTMMLLNDDQKRWFYLYNGDGFELLELRRFCKNQKLFNFHVKNTRKIV